MPIHVCPVCGARHEVSAVLHRLACGYALTCSPKCKVALGALARRRTLAEMAEPEEIHRRRRTAGED
ncbi:MAG: hypothetical protein JNK97_14345 [Zoogloea sp.]|nr:hypothetical protein [Zoogloea sp.]